MSNEFVADLLLQRWLWHYPTGVRVRHVRGAQVRITGFNESLAVAMLMGEYSDEQIERVVQTRINNDGLSWW